MKKLLSLIPALVLLDGCATQAALISQDSQRYDVQVSQMGHRFSVDVDGVVYAGPGVRNMATGFGTTQSFGHQPAFGTATIAVVGSNGRALLVAPNGDYIECNYTQNRATIVGKCLSNKGRQFVITTI